MGLKVSQNINDKNNKLYGSNFPLRLNSPGSTEGILEMGFSIHLKNAINPSA